MVFSTHKVYTLLDSEITSLNTQTKSFLEDHVWVSLQ